MDGTGVSVCTPGLAVAGVIVAPMNFVRSTAPLDSAAASFAAARLIKGNGFAPAKGLASAMGFGSDSVSAIAVAVKGAGTNFAGLGNPELFGSAADCVLEPPGTGGAVACAET